MKEIIVFTSIHFQSEDNNTETESSPSGYETDSSSEDDDGNDGNDDSDADDDTDIDVVIDEYRSCSSLATISLSSVDHRGKPLRESSMSF